ncbi:hypothetical protein AVEN_220327-1 [Araneus ventricosus]|uniref:Uncharacterized protein n=1 Tax=Araneus ventricosus TaxID=182803 RepID=A0A4Y2RFX2_ARAVE|nr:hypothetical protein AVEN_220327-1 [Araneus ventricosus]
MMRTTPELAPPVPNFRTTPMGGRLTPTYDLSCNRSYTRRIFSGIGFRSWNSPAETLPLGHGGLLSGHQESINPILDGIIPVWIMRSR